MDGEKDEGCRADDARGRETGAGAAIEAAAGADSRETVGSPDGLERIRELLRDDARLVERVVGETRVWDGKIFRVRTLDVALPDGTTGYREVVWHNGGAGVCAVRDGRMCLVRQYRVAMGRMSLEIPAGKLDAGEDPAHCAARELAEETGLVAQRLEFVARAAGSIGFTNEETSVFLAHGLCAGTARPDRGEFVDVAWLPVRDVLAAARAGLIQDGKTIIGALAAVERGLA